MVKLEACEVEMWYVQGIHRLKWPPQRMNKNMLGQSHLERLPWWCHFDCLPWSCFGPGLAVLVDMPCSHYRAAAFDVTGRKTSATLSVIFCFAHQTARQESSKFYSDLRNASSLALTKYYCINCRCSAVTMPIKLSSYVTWSASETGVSVQLPLNAVFFCLVEVVSHVILWRQCSCSIGSTGVCIAR